MYFWSQVIFPLLLVIPPSASSKVDFPAPFSPTIAVVKPCGISRFKGPNWEEYAGSGDGVMELGQNVGKIEDKYLKAYDLIDEYMDEMIASENA